GDRGNGEGTRAALVRSGGNGSLRRQGQERRGEAEGETERGERALGHDRGTPGSSCSCGWYRGPGQSRLELLHVHRLYEMLQEPGLPAAAPVLPHGLTHHA